MLTHIATAEDFKLANQEFDRLCDLESRDFVNDATIERLEKLESMLTDAPFEFDMDSGKVSAK